MLSCVQLSVNLWTDGSPPGPSVHGISPGKNTGVGCHALLQGIFPTQESNPGIEPRSPALQTDSLPSEPPGKRMNTGVGCLSLLQGIFPIQELNQGLLHCRWILFQLNYQGIPWAYSIQFSSDTQSCLTLCNPMNHSTPGFPVHHQLPELAQTHVH